MIGPRITRVVAAASCLIAFSFAPRAGAQSNDPLLEVVTQASNPIFVADVGDGRLFVVERAGYIRIFANGALQPEDPNAFLDIHLLVNTAGEGGLTSMAFDPAFATNHHVYVMFTRTGSGGSPLESVVARYTVTTDPNRLDPTTAKELLVQPSPIGPTFTNHKGGQLQVGPDGMLYIGFGDGGDRDDPLCGSQTRNVFFGKLLRIDPTGSGFGVGGIGYGIPSSNPFPTGLDANDPNNYRPEIWALGLRNPWRFSFDRQTSDLWIADVGQDAREEVDLELSGSSGGLNYGWNIEEGNIAGPNGGNPNANCPAYVKPHGDAGYTAPIFDYDHSVGSSITGGYVYRGSVVEWRGRYIYADYISGDIRYLSKNGQTWESTLVLDGDPFQPASFGEGSDGELYIAYLTQGWVYKLRFDRLGTSNENSACVVKLNEGFAKLAKTASKLNSACVAKAAKGKLGESDIQSCSANDPKLMKLGDKNRVTEGKTCGRVPAFGYTSASNGNIASYDSEIGLAHDVFGADLDLAIVLRAGDKATAVCQQAVLKGLAACQKTRRAEFVRCKKVGLKKGTILSVEQLANCLGPDPKGKIAKVCDATTGKLATRTIEKTCSAPGVDLSDAFPGCETDDPDLLAQCLASAGCLRSCELFDSADGLDTDCAARCAE